ncbi:DDB1- and CUL4-associated factor 6 isoform X1 [Dendroctonus ponderosae]|uniref:DDB1- and CUL4-associated factor 6 isoform X1 n=1 Tax=Dendroctonus ponderosae TaxID=77166 RepID=UPI002034CF69|nr:DDB1- and CUL4-associated factor 6 isoform X1 [Dendroctonus ponderosae]
MMNGNRNSLFKALRERPYGTNFGNIANTVKDDLALVQRLGLTKNLQGHKGCVNTICWNDKGTLILSGSDDQHLMVTNGFNHKIEANYYTSHKANIFSAKFLPCTNDQQIVSCSGDGIVLHTDLSRQQDTYHNQFLCHGGTTTYEVMTVPDNPHTFMSCGEDGTVRWFDLREKSSCTQQRCKDDILISCQRAITALAVSPTASHQLAVGCADSTVRIYDRRYLSVTPGEHLLAQPFCTFMAPKFGEERHYRITSLNYDSDGKDMLVSYSSDYLYLFNVQDCSTSEQKKPTQKPSAWDKLRAARVKRERVSPPPVRRLRLRGDWSDTGPDARPERDVSTSVGIGQARPQLQATLMQRMTDVLSRMLNDPMTRAALSAGGQEALDPEENAQRLLDGRPDAAGRVQCFEDKSFIRKDGPSGGLERSAQGVEGSSGSNEAASVSNTAQPQASASEPATPNQDTSTSTATRDGNSTVTSELHGHLAALRNLRQGFINRHGAEPSVSFRYSDQSTSSSTISLRANNQTAAPNVSQASAQSANTTEAEQPPANRCDRSLEMDVDYPEEESAASSSEPAVEKTEDNNDSFSMYEADVRKKYTGHRNARTMIKEATFWGSNYVMSGSDCGHVFIWNRHTTKLEMLLQADQHVVNCLRPHPTLPILATSGIDHDIKLWAPILDDCGFDAEQAEDLISRNAIMLEETRDTITVPAAFMIRMLACLNQIRRGARIRNRRYSIEEDS